jgi:hypothetical protein
MLSKDELFDWLCGLPDDAQVYCAGLDLRCVEEPRAEIQVGGRTKREIEDDRQARVG